jgi:hypothetical protein
VSWFSLGDPDDTILIRACTHPRLRGSHSALNNDGVPSDRDDQLSMSNGPTEAEI